MPVHDVKLALRAVGKSPGFAGAAILALALGIGANTRFGFPEMNGPRMTIIGVVGDTRDYGPNHAMRPAFFFSIFHSPDRAYTLAVRTHEPAGIVPAVRRAVAELDSGSVLSGVTTGEQPVADAVAPRRLNLILLAIFAGLALVLAAVGICGVMSYSISLRRQEIGVRMALGATSIDILRLMIGKAALLGGLGIVIGWAAGAALTRLMSGMLYGVQAADPATFTTVALALFLVAIAASYAPARRAGRISPIATLRCE